MKANKLDCQKENSLESIITYISFKAFPLSTRKLVKLVYLTDLYYYQFYGERLTSVGFKRYHYGPWAPEIEQTVEELCEDGILKEESVQTRDGYTAMVPKPAIKHTQVQLSDSVLHILDMVIKDFGSANPSDVVAFTKTNLPFVGSQFNEEIDFSRVDPAIAYAKAQGISVEQAATRDILDNSSFLEQIKNAEKELAEGRPLLTHKEVFGK